LAFLKRFDQKDNESYKIHFETLLSKIAGSLVYARSLHLSRHIFLLTKESFLLFRRLLLQDSTLSYFIEDFYNYVLFAMV